MPLTCLGSWVLAAVLMLCWVAETEAGAAAGEYSFAHTTQEQTELRVPFELPPHPSQSGNTKWS